MISGAADVLGVGVLICTSQSPRGFSFKVTADSNIARQTTEPLKFGFSIHIHRETYIQNIRKRGR